MPTSKEATEQWSHYVEGDMDTVPVSIPPLSTLHPSTLDLSPLHHVVKPCKLSTPSTPPAPHRIFVTKQRANGGSFAVVSSHPHVVSD